MRPIRLVTFDALHTIITPRQPIHVQYTQVFNPFVGPLSSEKVKQSFKVALKEVQKEGSLYDRGAENWWRDVIRRTAVAAGANETALDVSLSEIVQKLMKRFSSSEGYKAFEDAIPNVCHLHELGVHTAVVSNGDSRLREVLKDLGFPSFLEPIVLSEEEGVEKPSNEMFERTLKSINGTIKLRRERKVEASECLHVGDELDCDYKGAVSSGWKALLLRRRGSAGEQEHKEHDEVLDGVKVIDSLDAVVSLVQASRL